MVAAGSAAGKFTILDLSFDLSAPYTFWAGVLGGVALTLATHGTDQFLVQRLLSARSAREAARGLVLSGFIVFAQFIVFLLHRRDAVRLSTSRRRCRSRSAAPTRFCRSSSSAR